MLSWSSGQVFLIVCVCVFMNIWMRACMWFAAIANKQTFPFDVRLFFHKSFLFLNLFALLAKIFLT